MQEFFSTAAGCRVRYHDLPGAGVPVVFIHGLGCASSHDYPEVASQQCLAGRRRLLVDLPGAGYSERPTDFGYRVRDMAEVVLELLDHVGPGRVVLFGHSAGGAVALEVARHAERRLAGLVLSEANLDPSPPGAASLRIASQPLDDFIAHGYSDLLAEVAGAGDQWAAPVGSWSPAALWRLAESLRLGQDPSGRDVLYGLTCPRTYLIGELSLPDPDSAELTRRGVRVDVVPGVGHSMAWEDPAATAEAIAHALDVTAEARTHG